MKMTQQHYDNLVASLRGVKGNHPTITPKSYSDSGKPLKRFMWEAFHVARNYGRTDISELYSYLNDSHIETALKKAVKEVWG